VSEILSFECMLASLPWQQIRHCPGRYRLPIPEAPRLDGELIDGDEIAFGEVRGRVVATPGHTKGGVCLYFPQDRVLLAGDTLFAGGIGRTDLPGGSLPALEMSIRERLFTLPDDTVFYPGHGPAGTIGEEKRENPFFGEGA